MTETRTAWLLTRQWRDTADGLELEFWAATDDIPLCIQVPAQEAVCFIERGSDSPSLAGVRRHGVQLARLGGAPVDALYFRQQRSLQQLRKSGFALLESDVKPADRFLMERFITAGMAVQARFEERDGYRLATAARLRPADVQPRLRTVAIDIETRANTRELYSIGAALAARPGDVPASRGVVFMRGDGKAPAMTDFDLHYRPSEAALLESFFDWLAAADPDILTGWAVVNFDLHFLEQRCRDLGVPFRLGRGGQIATVLESSQPGQARMARVPGRAVLDGIDLLRAGFWQFDSFSLENVARELLGEGKLITPEQNKVEEINRLFATDKPQLAEYNLRDCTLVNDIFEKAGLVDFAVQRANLTGLAVDRLGGSVAAFDNLYLPRLHRQGFVAPDIGAEGDDGLGSPGGYVLDSVPGLYRNVLVLDFKSLYPSIIRTFFIDPLGLALGAGEPDAVPGYLDARFSRHTHILPGLIEELWSARDAAKRAGNAALSQAIKIIMNSFYGVLGTSACRFHSTQLASSITRRGHDIITRSRDWIEAQGYRVIYGDTDSLFVLLGPRHTRNSAAAIGTRLMDALNVWWQDTLKTEFNLESRLEVEYETHYSHFFMPTVRGMPTGSKKRYAGLVHGADGQPRLVVKGLEAARTDWTPLARNFQRELFRRVFLEEPFEAFVRETAERLQRGELDEQLVYRKRLRRRVDDYQRNVPPHVQAARKLARPGNWIRYTITRNGPEPVEQQSSPIDYQHYLDRQLAPAADGILQFMDTSFAAITDAQLSMF